MTFGSQFIMGGQGMPRRYFNYLDQFQPIHAFLDVTEAGFWARAYS